MYVSRSATRSIGDYSLAVSRPFRSQSHSSDVVAVIIYLS